ncbi:hypothetical protein FH609_000490 [Streptomyces sp. 3MP-14]|uniref:Uncharacterized protein n=1 Tax=Streptomyces mimosae TaxID=2586635 RepID=A0A5N6AT68_9ACTN|nr:MULTISPECIES: hypothetical protein [Streptomyces]KAB8171110.1 hypothetical protein FH607_001980 [Streptomyces mimosae]KAB8179538.1 hypothetical protein FH609_000490 [Streptomyces sp. 3MP-14]
MSPRTTRMPTIPQIHTYLRANGWESQPPGIAGTIWNRHDAMIGIPSDIADAPGISKGIVERIARFERKSISDVALSIRYHLMDVTYLRAANDRAITDTIPFESASTLIASARRLLRAVGTTAWRERGDIGGNYARQGDSVLRKSRMDHTQEGSFIIPILIPLPPVEETGTITQPQIEGLELLRAAPEPFERRVTRTLAQSLMAVREIIVEPERSPSGDDLHAVIARGVSKEFCSALARILSEPSVSEFETSFDWAPAVPAPETIPESVTIESDASGKIEEVANRLKKHRDDSTSTFSGNIVELRHVGNDEFGFATISTIRRGRRSEIRVRLPYEAYQEAVIWHRARRAVIVQGEVRHGSGRKLVVEHPVNFRPIDEILLQFPAEQ